MMRLWFLAALLHSCFSAPTLEQRVTQITNEAPSFHDLILRNNAFKLGRNRAINTVISKRRRAFMKALSLPKPANKKADGADDLLHLDDDVFSFDDLVPTFDDDTFSFDDDLFNLDDAFDFDDAFTFDDDYFNLDDDFWTFDDDDFSFDDDMWKFDDDTAYTSIDGYVSYAFTYGDACTGAKTMEVGVVAGTCFSDYVSSYMLQFSDASCGGLRVSFYEDTSCSSLLYTVPIDGFTDCMAVPMGNGTFYNSAQGMCTPGYTVSVDMNSVLLTVFENSETCAGVPVVYAAVATDICLTAGEDQSFELACDAQFDVFSGTNYSSSASCAAGSSGQQDFLFPLLCYDSSELSDLPISTYAIHSGRVGTAMRQPSDRAVVKSQRSIKRVHTTTKNKINDQPTIVKHRRQRRTTAKGDAATATAVLRKGQLPLKVQTTSKQVRKTLYKLDQVQSKNIKQIKQQQKKRKEKKGTNAASAASPDLAAASQALFSAGQQVNHHLRGAPAPESADDLLHLDDDLFHLDDALFADDMIPTFDDDLFSVDDIFSGFDDTITFDDDIWNFDDISLDDDFWTFDDVFDFDDDGDDDVYSSAVFSFNIQCGSTSKPVTYTPLPTVMPTGMPLAPPSPKPTAMPSQAVASTVSFEVSQVLYGMTYDTYLTNPSLYSSTLIQTIAQCMTGVTTSDIVNFNVAAGSSTRRLQHLAFSLMLVDTERLFKQLEEAHARAQVAANRANPATSSSSIILSYTVTVDSNYDYESLSNELQSNIVSGVFDSYMVTNSETSGAYALTTCYSDSATSTQTSVNAVGDDDANNGSGSSGGLSGGGIAGVVIAVLLVLAIGVGAYFFWVRKNKGAGGAAPDNNSSTSETSKTSAAAAAPVGPATEFVTLKDIQLTTAPVYGITTITNDGNAAEAHDQL